MSQTVRRRNQGIFLPKGERNRIRRLLLERDGNNCCWCNEPMLIPAKGLCISNSKIMATIEHYYALEADQPKNINLLRLAHLKCNR